MLFAAGIALVVRSEAGRESKSLLHLLPVPDAQGMVVELPLGASKAEIENVEEILQFEECTYREISMGARKLSVFATTWKPGSVPPTQVAAHTPDQCWPAVGQTLIETRPGESFACAGLQLLPAESRVFADNEGRTTYVAFWHIVGKRLFNPSPARFSGFREALRQLAEGDNRQYFVRIASRYPIAELLGDREMAEALAPFLHQVVGSRPE